MTKKEIKEYVENDIQNACDEGGLSREEVLETVLINIIYRYEIGLLTKEDLLQCGEYLGVELDMSAIDEQITKRKVKKENTTKQNKEVSI